MPRPIIHIPVLRTQYGIVTDLVLVHPGRYGNGQPALVLQTQDGEPYAGVTVNLDGNLPAEGAFWVKDYSENAGLADALFVAGVITLTGRVTRVGFGTAVEARLAEGLTL